MCLRRSLHQRIAGEDFNVVSAARGLPSTTRLRSSKYLNNLIEQDHRHIKSRINVMLGFKRFSTAAVSIAGIELMHRIRKGQFRLQANLKRPLRRQYGMPCFSLDDRNNKQRTFFSHH